MDLRIDPDELVTCMQCGLCLSACPTYRVTGDETYSPRGRIALMREVQDHEAPLTAEVIEAFDTCIQCRACEPACPSGVPYGHLIERTKETLTDRRHPRLRSLALRALRMPRLLRFGSSALALAQRARLVPKPLATRLGLPQRLPVRRSAHNTSGRDVYLFTGCVMDAWQRDVHHAAQRVLEAAGFGVTPTGDLAPCCGALHLHAGLRSESLGLTAAVDSALDPTIPVLVDSAGCGAHLKDHSSLRVYDIQEFLADHLDRLPEVTPLDLRVAVQDPCHLRHVQKVHPATRAVLRPFVREVAELDDDGMCCGAGGAYSVLEPEMSGQVRERKLDSINRLTPDVVASANPGCSMHLAAAGVPTIHPMQLIAQAIDG
ncbi:MAG: (Fe-S)-binding protein [Ilumatobacteraceae bacterium]